MGERRAAAGEGITLRATVVVVFSFFLLGGLLNGRHLHEDASLRPYGTARDFWMRMTAPLAGAAEWLQVDRLRDWAESTRNEPK